jgi:hypothetical protein
MRSISFWARSERSAFQATSPRLDSAVAARAITAGAAPFTKHLTTGLPDPSVVELKVAISL